MSKIRFQTCGRSMRWYEWFAALLLVGAAFGVRAGSVYKCTDAEGGTAYQAQPCPPQQAEAMVTIAPAPAYVAPPEYALDKPASQIRSMPREQRPLPARRSGERTEQSSYECRVSDGEVFYRHTPCPHSLAANGTARSGKSHDSHGGQNLTVSSRRISREEACMQIRRPGAIGRTGRAHDEDVSTYDRNLGNDPCK